MCLLWSAGATRQLRAAPGELTAASLVHGPPWPASQAWVSTGRSVLLWKEHRLGERETRNRYTVSKSSSWQLRELP